MMEKFLHLHEEARQWLNTLGYAQENTKDNRRLIVQCAFFAEEMLKKQQSEKSEEMLKGRQSEPTAHAWIPAHKPPSMDGSPTVTNEVWNSERNWPNCKKLGTPSKFELYLP